MVPATLDEKVQINHPGSLAMTLDGDVLFADTNNNLIRAYVPSTGYVMDDIGGLIDNGTPQGGFNGDGHYADQTKFDHPQAVRRADPDEVMGILAVHD